MRLRMAAMINALTIDVEDYFQVNAFEPVVSRSNWDAYPLRVVDNTSRVLDILDETGVKGTFFVLGWVAERAPELVRAIADRGHEVACHGYGHELVFRIGPERFRRDIRISKALLEDACGRPVRGYRAPSYSITAQSLWAFEILAESGFSYDSSIFPIHHDVYGIPGARRCPHRIETAAGSILEFPLTTVPFSVAGRQFNMPVAGGGYFRLLPVSLVCAGLRAVNGREGMPAVFYLHPWEFDPDQPRIPGAGLKSRFRHYVNLSRTADKFRKLLSRFSFAPMEEVLKGVPGLAAEAPGPFGEAGPECTACPEGANNEVGPEGANNAACPEGAACEAGAGNRMACREV